MPGQRITETTLNARFHDVLCSMHPGWRKSASTGAERTRVIRGERASQPDVVIAPPRSAPVIVECKIGNPGDVEEKAGSRLGKQLDIDGRGIETALCLLYPTTLSVPSGESLDHRLRIARDLQWAVLSKDGSGPPSRFPNSGWVTGSAADIAGVIESMAVSSSAINQAADTLENAMKDAAGKMVGASTPKAAAVLHQADGEQTRHMAAAVILNAFVFQTTVSDTFETPTIDEIRRGPDGGRTLHKRDVLDCWDEILTINYWPIFSIAQDVLRVLSDTSASDILDGLADAAQSLAKGSLATVQDLAGHTFGTLITDRKFLAAFYTLPTSAALLAELAVSRLDTDWSSDEAVAGLRVADLACGTGALLSAAYRRIVSRVRRAGSDDERLHTVFMEQVLIGCDVMPSAAHLTTTMLSSVHPDVVYERCGIHVVPYGEQNGPDSRVLLGSLELTGDGHGTRSLFGAPGKALAATAEDVVESETELNVPDRSLDLVIMNPPFTRSTGHEGDRVIDSVPVPAFAGLSTSNTDQRRMSARLKELTAGKIAGHGNAGLASHFLDLAHAKLRHGGVLAFVLPYTFVSGGAWKGARKLLNNHYTDITVIAIASDESTGRAFSADTHMAEVLVVATKAPEPDSVDKRSPQSVVWTSLAKRPERIVEAVATARVVTEATKHLVDSTTQRITLGEDHVATAIGSTIDGGGAAAVRSPVVASAAVALANGQLILPRLPTAAVAVTPLGNLGEKGPYHLDIRHYPRDNPSSGRAPFEVHSIGEHDPTPAYPVLWSHDTESGRESTMAVEPDKQAVERTGMRDHALRVWGTATRLHYNRDFQLNSQRLAAAVTEQRCLGGRGWPSWIAADPSWETPLGLWANTILGLVGYWWTATRQQQGRAALSITSMPELPVVDCRVLGNADIEHADRIFELFQDRDLLPANEAWRDPVRQELDEQVLCSWLKLHEAIGAKQDDFLDALAVLRTQWCQEPSVHGGKATRPDVT